MGRTRVGLLAGAARSFAEHGPRRSTMQSIATAAGVAKATLYNHFRTKDEVSAALLATELDRLTALAEGLPLDQALAVLSDELGAHPVLRRLAETEPEVLTRTARDGGRALDRADRPPRRGPARRPRRRRAGRPVAPGRGSPAGPVHDPPSARHPAGRRPPCRLSVPQPSGRVRVNSVRSAPGPAWDGEDASCASNRRARVRTAMSSGTATACTARAPTDAASRANRSTSRPATPRPRQAGWTARAWTTPSRSALTTPSR